MYLGGVKMKRSKYIILVIIMITFLVAGCTNPVDLVKKYVFNKPQEEENPLSIDGEEPNGEIEDVEDIKIPDENSRQTTLYYRDSTGYLVPVVRNIPRVEGIANAALSALVDTPENRLEVKQLGLQPVLPANTEMELAVKEDGLMKVNFSKEILNVESKEQEASMVKAVVYTLTEFETVESVQIMVDNKIQETLTYGTDISEPLLRNNINALNNPVEGESARVTLYLYNNPSGNYTYFVPITKNVPANGKNMETAVKELVSSKDEVGKLQLNLPKDVSVHGVNVESGIAYVNFSEELATISEKNEISNISKAIALTLKEFEGINGVKFMIEGKESSTLGNEPFAVPTFTNHY